MCCWPPAPRRRWCAAEEAPEFSRISGAVVINIGTLSQPWLDSMLLTAQAASQASVPWVLDPVAHHATAFRRDAVRRLLALKPAIIRGNASEIIALAGGASAGRGVDAGDPVAQAEQSARELALAQETVVAVTGEVDYVTDGHRAVRIAGGDALMPRVTATGCALTALTGAFAAVAGQVANSMGSRQAPRAAGSRHAAYAAAVAALSCFAIAGRRAGAGRRARSRGASWTRWPPCVRTTWSRNRRCAREPASAPMTA